MGAPDMSGHMGLILFRKIYGKGKVNGSHEPRDKVAVLLAEAATTLSIGIS